MTKEMDILDLLIQSINKYFLEKHKIHHAIIQISIPGPYLIRLDREAYQALNLGPVMMELNEILDTIGFNKIEFGHSGCYIATREK